MNIQGVSKKRRWLRGAAAAVVLVWIAALGAGMAWLVQAAPSAAASPEQAAEQFLGALVKGEYKLARQFLTDEAAQANTTRELQRLMIVLNIHDAGGLAPAESAAYEDGEKVVVEVHLESTGETARVLVLPVVYQHGGWRVASVDPIWRMLIQPPMPDILVG